MTKILIAEDNSNWQATLKRILLKINSNYQVKVVGSSGRALEEFDRQNYDLLITDLRLRGTDIDDKSGLTLIKAVKKLNPILPTIIITLYPDDEIVRLAYTELGVTYFLNKVGLDLEKLKRAVEISLKKIPNQRIREKINQHFSREDLENVLFDFHLSFDELHISESSSKNRIIRLIIEYFERTGQSDELIKKITEIRPSISWFSE